MSGYFITLEGIEGAGKSTQMAVIRDALSARGLTVNSTREPGGTPVGERVRGIFLDPDLARICSDAELLLVYAARAQHVQDVIRPALQRAEVLLCDRFEDSTFAYQGAGRGVAAERIEALSHWALQGFAPDLTLWLDVDPAIGLTRAKQRSQQDRMEQETLDFFRRVRAGFAQRCQQHPQRMLRIDADATLAAVSAQVLAAVLARVTR